MDTHGNIQRPGAEPVCTTTGPSREDKLCPAATVFYQPVLSICDTLLSALDRGGRRIYIFLNGPVDSSIEQRLSHLADATIIRSSENIGLGAGLNAILERATSDGFSHILLLDQDSSPTPELPESLLACWAALNADGHPLAAIGPLLVPPLDSDYLTIRYPWRGAKSTVDFLPTSGTLIALDAWRCVGPFRGDYFIGGIDVEWGFRAWNRGLESVVARDIEMVHRWGTTSEGKRLPQILRQSDTRTYYYVRNFIDCVKLPHVPILWKVRHGIILAGQLALLLVARQFNSKTMHLLKTAVSDGWKKRLGPIPVTLQPNGAGS